MDAKKDTNTPTEYRVGNTLYLVNSVYKEAHKAEHITDKILRLILRDRQHKDVV